MVAGNRITGILLLFLAGIFPVATGHTSTEETPSIPIVVETPNPCSSIDSFDTGNLYLKKPEKCGQPGSGVAKLFLPITNHPSQIQIFVNGKFWKTHAIPEFNVSHLQDLFDRKKCPATKLSVPRGKGEFVTLPIFS